MAHMISRIASLVIALPMMAYGIYSGIEEIGFGPNVFLPLIVFIPLAFIWFPEVIGSATGYIGHGRITAETPPVLVAAAGWFFLVGLPVILYLINAG